MKINTEIFFKIVFFFFTAYLLTEEFIAFFITKPTYISTSKATMGIWVDRSGEYFQKPILKMFYMWEMLKDLRLYFPQFCQKRTKIL